MDYRNLYEQICLGVDGAKFPQIIPAGDTRNVTELFRFVFERLLRWPPRKTEALCSDKLLRFLQLGRMAQYLPLPAGVNEEDKGEAVTAALYPDKIRVSRKARIWRTYVCVLDGTLVRFPKNFFRGADGADVACVCLAKAINMDLDIGGMRQLYAFFNDAAEARKWLRKMHLLTVCDEIFSGDLLYFLRRATAGEPESEAWYQYTLFCNAMRAAGVTNTVDDLEKAAPIPVCIMESVLGAAPAPSDSDALPDSGTLPKSGDGRAEAAPMLHWRRQYLMFQKALLGAARAASA